MVIMCVQSTELPVQHVYIFVVIVLQKACFVFFLIYWGGASPLPTPHPFISLCLKNYEYNVFELVGVSPVSRTSHATNREL